MSLTINVCQHLASLVMPNCDPQVRFFYPTLTLMIDPYNMAHVIVVLLFLLIYLYFLFTVILFS